MMRNCNFLKPNVVGKFTFYQRFFSQLPKQKALTAIQSNSLCHCRWFEQQWRSFHRSKIKLLKITEAEKNAMTMQEVIKKCDDMINLQPLFFTPRKTPDISSEEFKNQSELSPRRMLDNLEVACIPIGRDEVLRERYITYYRTFRYGRILEDMDYFALWVSMKHCVGDVTQPGIKFYNSLVTALLDRIIIKQRIVLDKDIWLRGHLTWVGKSSMEVLIQLLQLTDDGETTGETEEKLYARFVFVNRSPNNDKKMDVNPLELTTDEEKEIFKEGEERALRRRQTISQSLLNSPPNEDERRLIHDMFLETIDSKTASYVSQKPPDTVWMRDTWLKNNIICNPEERNVHGKIFGGFIMRQAYELAWTNALIHCNAKPKIVAIHDIVFKKPVEVGAVLSFSSKIVYTEGQLVQVRVRATVIRNYDFNNLTRDTTNQFQFTFKMENPVPHVHPMTYAEAMMYLDGKRICDIQKQIESQL